MRQTTIGIFVGTVLAVAFVSACGGSGTGSTASVASDVAALQAQVLDLHARLAAMESTFSDVRRSAEGDLVIEGANLLIQDGTGTSLFGDNGKGNLILGYNENDGTDVKIGTHNLVIGPDHTYTANAGIVCGRNHRIGAIAASVLAGDDNSATGFGACVTGGSDNEALGDHSVVSGGGQNRALGVSSSVSGGLQNDAVGTADSVLGGVMIVLNGGGSTSPAGP